MDGINKLEHLMRTQQEYKEGNIIFLYQDMATATAMAPLYSALGLFGQAETADGKILNC